LVIGNSHLIGLPGIWLTRDEGKDRLIHPGEAKGVISVATALKANVLSNK
jgi:hypothetical protein